MSSYIKFLSRNKLYTVIEAVGLIISIAFVILIGNYVYQQYSVAYGNPLGKRIYAVGNQDYLSLSWWDKAAFEAELPEAEAVCRISGTDDSGYVTIGDESISAFVTEADPELFELFPSLSLIDGSMDEYRLNGHCLISESLANSAFNGDAIGKPLKISYFNNLLESVVCGVFKDDANSMILHTDVFLNPGFGGVYHFVEQKPFSSIGNYTTLIKVHEGTDREAFAKKVEEVGLRNYSDSFVKALPIYTLPEVFFHEDQWVLKRGDKSVLQMLTIVVLLLLLSAIFNYINLNMALSGKRAKEMATRRLHGATKGNIIMKYILESVAFTAVCFVLAFLLAYAFLPMMNDLLKGVTGGSIPASFDQFVLVRFDWSVGIVVAYLGAIVLLGVLAGMAPAAIASRFKPIDVVRGTYRLKTKRVFSKVFIVFQNTITVALIAMALLMEVQMRHMMNRPVNMRSEGLYSLNNWAREYSDIAPLINRLEQIPNVKTVGYGRGFAGQLGMGTSVETPDSETVNMQLILCDETYFNMLDLQVVEDYGARTNSVWMSRTLAEKLALNDSTMQYYPRRMRINGARPETVGGIYEDIPTRSASASEPNQFSAVIIAKDEDLKWGNGVMVDVSGDYKETEKAIMQAYADYSEEKNGTYVEPAQNGYVKDLNNLLLQPAKMAMRLLELFMLLSVLISLLGLMAMSTYYSEQSTKSIAVRKVFGSNVRRELWRSVKDYMVLVGIAALIGIPLAVWFCGRYLDRFAYRIEHYGWIIAVAAILGMLMAFLSVLWQTLKAARTNPAEALKKE